MLSLCDLMVKRLEHVRRTGESYAQAYKSYPVADAAGNPIKGKYHDQP